MSVKTDHSWVEMVEFLKSGRCSQIWDEKPCEGLLRFIRVADKNTYDVACNICGSTPREMGKWAGVSSKTALRLMIYFEFEDVKGENPFHEIRCNFHRKRYEKMMAEANAARSARVGIPTIYKGIHFRSRLEAKWAYFFDLIGWPYQYEPFELDGYIPDFVLTFADPVLVEVKPVCSISEVVEKCEKPIVTAWNENRRVLIVGGNIRHEQEHPKTGVKSVVFNAGWFALGQDETDSDDNISPAPFMRCPHCRRISTYPSDGIRSCFLCGRSVRGYDTESSLFANGDHVTLLNLWQRACNAAQYNKPHATGI